MPLARALDRNRTRLSDFCRRNHIRRLLLFGSRLHGEEHPESDIDLIVEFHPGHVPGFAFTRMQEELSALLGYPVDLNTPAMLSRYFRDEILATAEVLYAEP